MNNENYETLEFLKKRILENINELSARQLKSVADFTDEIVGEVQE
jgi:hypothetical protein